jgi:preprotein translocase subunit SecG
MYQFILLIHVFTAALIIVMVLLQQGKGAAMGAAFGSGASQTVFGSRGSGSFLFKVTLTLISIFFVTSLALNYLAMHAYKQERVITLPAPTKQRHTLPMPSIPTLPEIPVRK